MDTPAGLPEWLTGHVKATSTNKDSITVTLCSTTGNDYLEVWYSGKLETSPGSSQPYIVDDGDATFVVCAKDPSTGELFLVFDEAKHGYASLPANQADLAALELTQMALPPVQLLLDLHAHDDDVDMTLSYIDSSGNPITFVGYAS